MNFVRSLVAAVALAVAGSAWAYQVTGPVLEVSDSKIVVQKGKEKWEIARTPDTKITGDLKVGSKVTIEYSMTAKSVDVKADKGKSKK
jgi:cytochrome c1